MHPRKMLRIEQMQQIIAQNAAALGLKVFLRLFHAACQVGHKMASAAPGIQQARETLAVVGKFAEGKRFQRF